MSDHWLTRASTVRLLWAAFIFVLALTLVAEAFITHQPHFAVEALFGFGAWYGFIACAGLIVFAKGIGALLKRHEDYYEPRAGDD